MIVDLPETTSSQVAKEIQQMREAGGVVALGRVLTLVVLTRDGFEEEAITAANLASREHPCRIIVITENHSADTRLDAQIRVGGDAGASEVIVLRAGGQLCAQSDSLVAALLLPDAPIVAWWPHAMPQDIAKTPIGRIAHRRITDSAAEADPQEALKTLSSTYSAGNTDLAWTRLTNWRTQLAAVFDELDASTMTSILVEGASDSPSTLLLAAWLQWALGLPVQVIEDPAGTGIRRVVVEGRQGSVELVRPGTVEATLSQPDQPVQHISLPRRSLQDCLSEELRRLDADVVFGDVITTGMTELMKAGNLEEAVS